ncbi:MAG TPA: glycosyltransferase [Candidatus Sulfotelmatobacter sp.]|jgi:GT2 family glycosyltransferase
MSSNDIQKKEIARRPGSIASVTVAYNGEDFLSSHLDALLRQSEPLDEIIVVNNASTDASLRLLRERYPQVTVIDLAGNAGVGGGYAAGLDYALNERHHHWIWLFDQDSIPRHDGLARLLDGYHSLGDHHSDVAIFAPLCIHSDTQRSYPGVRWRNGWRKCKTTSNLEFVDAVISSGSLVRGEHIRKVGLPRADFFIDFVDFEHCLRLRKHGYRIAVVPESILDHSVGKPRMVRLGSFSYTWSDHEPWREYYKTRNEVFTIWAYDSRWQAKAATALRLARHAVGILLFGKAKFACLKMMCFGFFDGRAGKLGVRSFDRTASPISAPQEQHAGD